MTFKDKWILITGASSGLGTVYADEFARQGANLILASRNESKLTKIAQKLRSQFNVLVEVIPIDLAKVDGAELLYGSIVERKLDVFGVVNNAGVGVFGKLGESSLEKNQREILLNVYAVSTLSQLFVGKMAERKKGFVVNIASVAAYGPAPYMANYAASKAFVLSFTTALWAEYRKSGVRIFSVCPGVTDTAFFDVVGGKTVAGSNWKRDPPELVVKQTIRMLDQRGPLIIAGSFRNRALALVSNLIPNAWVARVVAAMHQPTN